MKIIQLITPTRISGAEKYMLQLSKELIEAGHEVIIITEKGCPLTAFASQSFNIIEINIEGKANIFGYYRLKKTINNLRPDIIHCHLSTASFFGSLIGKALNIPVIATAHAIDPPFPIKNANKIIAVSKAVENYLVKKNIDKSRIKSILNGIPLLTINETQKRAIKESIKNQYNIYQNHIIFAVVAHFSAKKGHEVLFHALKSLKFKNWTLLLIGEGKRQKNLKNLSKKLNLENHIIFTGYFDNIYDILPAIDVLVLPSIKGEGLPLSILEAQSQSIPVIASNLSGINEIIKQNENGFLFEPGNSDELKQCLERFENVELLKEMGSKGKKIIEEKFQSINNSQKVISLYTEMLNKTNSM